MMEIQLSVTYMVKHYEVELCAESVPNSALPPKVPAHSHLNSDDPTLIRPIWVSVRMRLQGPGLVSHRLISGPSGPAGHCLSCFHNRW